MSTDADALAKVDEFEKDGSTAGVWRGIRKDEVVAGLRERLRNKDGLNQHNTGLCAVASLVHIELQDDPVSFVTLAVGLYKSGQASWRGQVVKPNNELLANSPPDGQVINGTAQVFNRADWIVMSSIRNTVNPVDHYNRASAAGTDLAELEKFIRQVGYTDVVPDYSRNSFSKDKDNAKKASDLLGKGYRVILNINADMLSSSTQTDLGLGEEWYDKLFLAAKPNHIVQLIDPIQFFTILMVHGKFPLDTHCVKMAVYTWAQGHRKVPELDTNPLEVKDFLWNYYGYLAFKN
jgi:hypothetical protein